jgi:ribonuclease HI
MKPLNDSVIMYADGACKGNPGPGGWGVLLQNGSHEKELFGGEPNTTNNQMELMAVIKGLEAIKRPCQVQVFTDSVYVQKGMTEWLPNWKKRGWKTSANKPLKNMELWQLLDKLSQNHQIQWNWIKGHAGHPGNERADLLANQGVVSVNHLSINREIST